jgi:radical SAM superfamily enzyme YgiQ (UPF0313 family)
MRLKLIYPKWPKLKHQPEFNLPPHGPVVFAASLPSYVEVSFVDEHVSELKFDIDCDLVAISCMLSCQIKRGFEIADKYRSLGKKVIMGGIAVMLHADEAKTHADAIFLGESEGHIEDLLNDLKAGKLKPVYDYLRAYPDTSLIGPARRDILKRDLYNFRGVQMVDLIHASRGCKFNCFPCCTPYLGGRNFRPRPVKQVIAEMEKIDNNRLFIVDNSLAQDDEWEKELFKAMIPLKKKWVSHPIKDDDEILDLAAKAGCWYVYQAVVDTSDYIRKRIKRLKERGIGVEGTIILGTDEQDEDYIKRFVDFLLDIELDLAEFTVLTPFAHTPIREKFLKENRILHNDWNKYTGGEAVFKPAKMTAEALDKMYDYAWETFYHDESKEVKMGKLYLEVIKREQQDGTYKPLRLRKNRGWVKKND